MRFGLVIAGVFVASACATRRPPPDPTLAAAIRELPAGPVVSAGTRIRATLDDEVHGASDPSQTFTATLPEPVLDELGNQTLPAGAKLTGRVGGFAAAPASGALVIQSITFDGATHPLEARVIELEPRLDDALVERLVGNLVLLGTATAGAVMGTVIKGGVGGAMKGSVVAAGAVPPNEGAPSALRLAKGSTIVVETTTRFATRAPR